MPLQRDKAKQLHARRNFRPHPRVTPKAIVRERIGSSDAYSELFRRSVRFLGRHVCFRYGAGNGGLPVGSP